MSGNVFSTPQSLSTERAQPARFVGALRRIRIGDDRHLEHLRLHRGRSRLRRTRLPDLPGNAIQRRELPTARIVDADLR